MDGPRAKQSGLSALEALLIILAVGVIGVVSVVVYQHNRVQLSGASGGTQATNQTSTQQTTTTTNQSVVRIPELGIQITVPNDIKDLTYQMSTTTVNGQQIPLARFSTATLAALDAKCSASAGGPLGSLGRVDGVYPASANPVVYGTLVKQFPTFYIAAGHPNAACSEQSSALSAMSKFRQEFEASYSTIQALN